MSLRLKLAALFFTISQFFLIQQIFAESVHIAQSSSAQPAASHDDAIQKFVRADFAKRRAMLDSWYQSRVDLSFLHNIGYGTIQKGFSSFVYLFSFGKGPRCGSEFGSSL